MTITRAVGAHTRAAARVTGAAVLTGLCSLGAPGAAADEAGGVAVRVEISNATDATLECQALAAHWYSFPVLQVAPGGSVTMQFTLLKSRGEVTAQPVSPLPIEMLYCGLAGRAWATRSAIDLFAVATLAARQGGTARLVCRAGAEAVACATRP